MAKQGRPSTYTPEIGAAICERLAAGESLRSICSDDSMPNRCTVAVWVTQDREGFASQYTRAREVGLDILADEVLEIADDASRDITKMDMGDGVEVERVDHEHIQRSRLRFDARRWYLSKLAPKRYGDRLELAGDKDAPLQQRVEVVFVPSKKEGE